MVVATQDPPRTTARKCSRNRRRNAPYPNCKTHSRSQRLSDSRFRLWDWLRRVDHAEPSGIIAAWQSSTDTAGSALVSRHVAGPEECCSCPSLFAAFPKALKTLTGFRAFFVELNTIRLKPFQLAANTIPTKELATSRRLVRSIFSARN